MASRQTSTLVTSMLSRAHPVTGIAPVITNPWEPGVSKLPNGGPAFAESNTFNVTAIVVVGLPVVSDKIVIVPVKVPGVVGTCVESIPIVKPFGPVPAGGARMMKLVFDVAVQPVPAGTVT